MCIDNASLCLWVLRAVFCLMICALISNSCASLPLRSMNDLCESLSCACLSHWITKNVPVLWVLTWWWARQCRGERCRCLGWHSRCHSGSGWISATYRSCPGTSLHGGWSLELADRQRGNTEINILRNRVQWNNQITVQSLLGFHRYATCTICHHLTIISKPEGVMRQTFPRWSNNEFPLHKQNLSVQP